MKYHISEDGKARPCKAEAENCPVKGPDGVSYHANSIQETRELYEKANKKNNIQTFQKETLTLTNNNSPLTKTHYEASVKASGRINPNSLDSDSWKKFGFSGPNIIKSKRSTEELTFFNYASVEETKRLSVEEMDAIRFFTSSKFANFNRVIFGNKKPDADEVETYKQIQHNMDQALSKSLNVPKIVYRGVKTRASVMKIDENDSYQVKEEKINQYVNENFNLGETVDFKGYQSTSLDPNVATEWADKDGIVFEIMTPKGVNITALSQNPEETEVLIPRESRYVVVGVQKPTDIPFSYRSKPSHVIQLVAVDENNNVL